MRARAFNFSDPCAGYRVNGRLIGSSADAEHGGDLNLATLERVSLAPGAKIQLDSKLVDHEVTAFEIVNGVFRAIVSGGAGGEWHAYPGVKNVEILGDEPFGADSVFVDFQAGGDMSIDCGNVGAARCAHAASCGRFWRSTARASALKFRGTRLLST
jgi:hypothetical protein